MDAIEKFRETVTNAITAATAAGVEQGQLNKVLLRLAGFDPAAAREAAESVDGMIDREQDDLAEQLAPARDLLRRIAGNAVTRKRADELCERRDWPSGKVRATSRDRRGVPQRANPRGRCPVVGSRRPVLGAVSSERHHSCAI